MRKFLLEYSVNNNNEEVIFQLIKNIRFVQEGYPNYFIFDLAEKNGTIIWFYETTGNLTIHDEKALKDNPVYSYLKKLNQNGELGDFIKRWERYHGKLYEYNTESPQLKLYAVYDIINKPYVKLWHRNSSYNDFSLVFELLYKTDRNHRLLFQLYEGSEGYPDGIILNYSQTTGKLIWSTPWYSPSKYENELQALIAQLPSDIYGPYYPDRLLKFWSKYKAEPLSEYASEDKSILKNIGVQVAPDVYELNIYSKNEWVPVKDKIVLDAHIHNTPVYLRFKDGGEFVINFKKYGLGNQLYKSVTCIHTSYLETQAYLELEKLYNSNTTTLLTDTRDLINKWFLGTGNISESLIEYTTVDSERVSILKSIFHDIYSPEAKFILKLMGFLMKKDISDWEEAALKYLDNNCPFEYGLRKEGRHSDIHPQGIWYEYPDGTCALMVNRDKRIYFEMNPFKIDIDFNLFKCLHLKEQFKSVLNMWQFLSTGETLSESINEYSNNSDILTDHLKYFTEVAEGTLSGTSTIYYLFFLRKIPGKSVKCAFNFYIKDHTPVDVSIPEDTRQEFPELVAYIESLKSSGSFEPYYHFYLKVKRYLK